MTDLSELEENMETLDDVDELAERVGSGGGDKPAKLEDDILNAKFEHAESIIDQGGDEEYYLLDDVFFEKMEFKTWNEEDVSSPIHNINEYRRDIAQRAFGGVLSDQRIEDIIEHMDWRDVKVTLDLKDEFEGTALDQRIRGYFREASSSVKHYIEKEGNEAIKKAVRSQKAIIPGTHRRNGQDVVIEANESIEHSKSEHVVVGDVNDG